MPDPLLKECHGMTDADYDAEVRFAGAGVLRDDTEYQYPPAKWDIKPVTTWPAEVDRRLSHIEALVHKAINQPSIAPSTPDLRDELRACYLTMRTIANVAADAHEGDSVAMRGLFELIDEMRTRYAHKWNGGL